MNPTPKKKSPSSLPEDERPTLPDINVDEDKETSPRRRGGNLEEDIGAVQRPPADS